MKKILLKIAETIYTLIFCIGCITIYELSAARQPMGTKVVLAVIICATACGLFWMLFIRPCFRAFKEESSKPLEPTSKSFSDQEERQP